MRSRIRSCTAVLFGTLIAIAGGMVSAPHAWTQPPAPAAADDFYFPPTPLPSGPPGAIVRAQPASLMFSAPGQPGVVPAISTRMMYLSNDTHDAPTAVTGTYLRPMLPWTGSGERPVVAYAVGTQGQGDQCAPSKLLSQFVRYQPPFDIIAEYDVLALYSLLSRGMAVVVTDYHGLGTPEMHDFLNRKAQSYAVLDSARAAQQLPDNGLGPRPPVIVYGYSQGGMASAGAAELQPSYAPELNMRGAYIGGPVVDPEYFIGFNEGQPSLSGAVGFTLNGIAADYPDTRPELDAELNDAGKALLRDAAEKCAIAVSVDNPQRQTARFTSSGQPLTTVIDRSPALSQAFADQRIGGGTPSAPVLIAAAKNDEGAPYGPIRDVAAAWCSRGVPVQIDANSQIPSISGVVGTHDLAFFPSLAASQTWLTDRLAAAPAASNCAALP